MKYKTVMGTKMVTSLPSQKLQKESSILVKRKYATSYRQKSVGRSQKESLHHKIIITIVFFKILLSVVTVVINLK